MAKGSTAMNGNNSYEERNSISYNRGEDIFEQYCEENNLTVRRLGFDEKKAPVDRFYDLPTIIRNLPDYIVTSEKKLVLVNVKGSLNFKEKEYELLEMFDLLLNTENSKLYYAFCLAPRQVIWRTLDAVRDAYDREPELHTWPDGKRYKTLQV